MEGSESNRLTLSLVGEGGPQPALSPAGAGRVRGREYVAEFTRRRTQFRWAQALQNTQFEISRSLL